VNQARVSSDYSSNKCYNYFLESCKTNCEQSVDIVLIDHLHLIRLYIFDMIVFLTGCIVYYCCSSRTNNLSSASWEVKSELDPRQQLLEFYMTIEIVCDNITV